MAYQGLQLPPIQPQPPPHTVSPAQPNDSEQQVIPTILLVQPFMPLCFQFNKENHHH